MRDKSKIQKSSSDIAIAPPAITRILLEPGDSFPKNRTSFFLHGDARYVVIAGEATFIDATSSSHASDPHGYGDVFFAAAGFRHHLWNSGEDKLLVAVVVEHSNGFMPVFGTVAPLLDCSSNPTLQKDWMQARSYRRLDGNATWVSNPSYHSERCMETGGVHNMAFDAIANSPAALRVRWSEGCQIPRHYRKDMETIY